MARAEPNQLSGDTGFLKKITLDTITTMLRTHPKQTHKQACLTGGHRTIVSTFEPKECSLIHL
eukprot:4578311-Pyramimonas_sp.AAC.1